MEKITRTARIQSLGTLDEMGPHVVLEVDSPGMPDEDGMIGGLVTGIPLSEAEVVALAKGPGLYGTVRVTIETVGTDVEMLGEVPKGRTLSEIFDEDDRRICLRACVSCPHIYTGPLACPVCGEPGEPAERVKESP